MEPNATFPILPKAMTVIERIKTKLIRSTAKQLKELKGGNKDRCKKQEQGHNAEKD